MKFLDCIKGHVTDGALSEDKAKEINDVFDLAFEQAQREGLVGGALEAEASRRATQALERKVMATRKETVAHLEAIERITKQLGSYKGDDAGQAILAMLDRDLADNAPYDNVNARYHSILGASHAMFEKGLSEYRPRVAGLYNKETGIRDVVRELFEEGADNTNAKEIAQSFKKASTYLRERANRAGADIAEREDFGLPQTHSKEKMFAVKADDWVAFVKDKLDWERMPSKKTGLAIAEGEREGILRDIYKTIITDGESKTALGDKTYKSRTAGLSDNRFLVFKNADSWLDYYEGFGEGTVHSVLTGHLDTMSRNISLLEVLGTKPHATKEWLKDYATKQAINTDIDRAGEGGAFQSDKVKRSLNTFDDLYAHITHGNQPVPGTFANGMAGTRNVLVASKLAGAFLSALSDTVLMRNTAKFNGLPAYKSLRKILKHMNPLDIEDQRIAVQSGLIAENWTSVAVAMQRYTGMTHGPEMSKRYADVVMRASLLSPWTQAGKWAFGTEFMGYMARAPKTFAEMDEPFKNALERYGITEADWETFKGTNVFKHKGAELLRPVDILERSDIVAEEADQIHAKLMQMITAETNFAVPSVSPRASVALTGNTKSGTFIGEAVNSVKMFKSFPMTIMQTHLMRGVTQKGAMKKGRYLSALVLGTTAMGAVVQEMKQIKDGKDPINPFENAEVAAKFWTAAFTQGASLGLIGDFLFGYGDTQDKLSGPVIGLVNNTIKLGKSGVNAIKGKNDDFGAEVANFAHKNLSPTSTLWYGKLAFERLFMDELNRQLDPKAYRKWKSKERRVKKQTGQGYWWKHGRSTPNRAPRF